MYYQRSSTILEKQADEHAASALEQVNLHISYMMDEMDTISNIIANQHDINEYLYESLQDNDRVRQIERYFRLKPLIQDTLNGFKKYGVHIYIPKHVFFSSEGNIIYSEEDIDNKGLYEMIKAKDGEALWHSNRRLISSFSTEEISQYKVIKHYYTNNVIGVIEVYLPVAYIEESLKKVGSDSGSVTLLLNNDGSILGANSSSVESPNPDTLQFIKRGAAKGSLHTGSGSNRKLLIYHKLENKEWTLVTSIPEAILYKSSKNIRNFSILMIIGVLCIVILFIYIIIKNSTKRLDRLIRVMSHVEDDGLKTVIPMKYNDEIGDLEKRFNNMRVQINNLIVEIYRAERQKKEAQFVALQAQVNPHFLYNTLDTINWMAINKEAYEISSIITSLSKFYRLTLNEGNEINTVKEEMDIIKQYVAIQKLRYDDDLVVEYHIDNEVLGCKAVKLTLQPIIENALKHGIQPSGRQGKIIVTGMAKENFVHIYIFDNGIGIQDHSDDLSSASLDRTGYGLKNVLERLVLHFGSDCSIELVNGQDEGAVTTIRWPLR